MDHQEQEAERAKARLAATLGKCNVGEPAPGHYWRVLERNSPHLVYCMRQATWRGPFETLNAAKADVLREGYQYADPCNEAEFKEEPAPKPVEPATCMRCGKPRERTDWWGCNACVGRDKQEGLCRRD